MPNGDHYVNKAIGKGSGVALFPRIRRTGLRLYRKTGAPALLFASKRSSDFIAAINLLENGGLNSVPFRKGVETTRFFARSTDMLLPPLPHPRFFLSNKGVRSNCKPSQYSFERALENPRKDVLANAVLCHALSGLAKTKSTGIPEFRSGLVCPVLSGLPENSRSLLLEGIFQKQAPLTP
jgi:hypothetical protein